MDVILDARAIIFKLKHDSNNLKPLMYFIEKNFQDVKHFSNFTVVLNEESRHIQKKYLLKWAHKVYCNRDNPLNPISLEQLIESLNLPIHVVIFGNNSIVHTATITIDHVTANELSVTTNQYYSQIFKYFRMFFKDSMITTAENKTFEIKIKTANDLILLKRVLSTKKISSISVNFVTHGLNLKRLHPEEVAYQEKLEKSYKILSVNYNSADKEIKNNYKKMLRKYHPDRVYSENHEIVALYTRRFQVIQEAYALIKEHHQVS